MIALWAIYKSSLTGSFITAVHASAAAFRGFGRKRRRKRPSVGVSFIISSNVLENSWEFESKR